MSTRPTLPSVVHLRIVAPSDRAEKALELLNGPFAERAGVSTFVLRVADFPDREAWDRAMADEVAKHEPHLVVSAGFMRLAGTAFLERFGGCYINTQTKLALENVVKVLATAGTNPDNVVKCTVFLVDPGVDTGPIIAQRAVPVLDSDDESALHERIKSAERELLVEVVGRMSRNGWQVNDRKVALGE